MAFKMKGNPYPTNRKGKINPNSEGNTDLKDGRSASAAFQYSSPVKQKTSREVDDLYDSLQLATKNVAMQEERRRLKEKENKPLCAKCGQIREGHDDSTHAFTTNPDDPDYEGGDTFDVKPE